MAGLADFDGKESTESGPTLEEIKELEEDVGEGDIEGAETAKDPEYDEPGEKEEKPEVKAEPEQEEKPEEERDGWIPGSVYQQRRREKLAEYNELLEKHNVLKGRFDQFTSAVKPKADDIPDQEVDPDGFRDHEVNVLKNEVSELRKYKEEQQSIVVRKAEDQQVINKFADAVRELQSEKPDAVDAYKHIRAMKYQQYAPQMRALNPNITEEEIAEKITEEQIYLGRSLEASGENPAKFMYNLAVNSYGWKPEAVSDNGKEPVETETKTDDKTESLKTANRSVATSGGGTEIGLTDMDIDDMNDAQFDEFVKIHSERTNPLRA